MSDGYNRNYRTQLLEVANKIDQKLYEGVYCMYSGPNFETPAEINALKVIGGRAVGMSTVPEAIVAKHAGIKTVAFSLVTNLAAGISENPLDHNEVIEIANKEWNFRNKSIVIRENNYGLKKNILNGVSEVINKFERHNK